MYLCVNKHTHTHIYTYRHTLIHTKKVNTHGFNLLLFNLKRLAFEQVVHVEYRTHDLSEVVKLLMAAVGCYFWKSYGDVVKVDGKCDLTM